MIPTFFVRMHSPLPLLFVDIDIDASILEGAAVAAAFGSALERRKIVALLWNALEQVVQRSTMSKMTEEETVTLVDIVKSFAASRLLLLSTPTLQRLSCVLLPVLLLVAFILLVACVLLFFSAFSRAKGFSFLLQLQNGQTQP